MCLIVDVNVAPNIFLTEDDPDFKYVHERLFAKTGMKVTLVYGGKLLDEYRYNAEILALLLALDRAGKARKVADADVNAECDALEKADLCQSNDHHIIALAKTGNVRLLCSRDQALTSDFTSKHLLDNPRGKVYKHDTHRALLRAACKPTPP